MTIKEKLLRLMNQGNPEVSEDMTRFHQITNYIDEVFFLCDPPLTRIIYISPGYESIWGRSCKSLYKDPRSFLESVHSDDRERAIQSIAPEGVVIPNDVEYRIVRPDGRIRWIRNRGYAIRNQSGDVYRIAGIAADITDYKNALETVRFQAKSLEQNNHHLSLLGEMTGLLQTAVGIEEAATIIEGYLTQIRIGDSGAAYLFKESKNRLDSCARWGDLKLPESITPDECWALRRGQYYQSPKAQPTLHCKHLQHLDVPATYICVPMLAESGILGTLNIVIYDETSTASKADVFFVQRISSQIGLGLANVRLREALRFESLHDSLTQLYNRRFLEDALKRECSRAERRDSIVAVAMLDIDHFKRFNDEYGHKAGDAALQELGQVLLNNCRTSDLACRFGGEEFTVVLPDVTREAAEAWVERLLEAVRKMKVIVNGTVLPQITVSIGIALFPEHGKEAVEVIQTADRALYSAKSAGRDRYVLSTE